MTSGPSFTSSREHPPGLRWSGLKTAPWRLRSNCPHGWIEPAEAHYLATQRGPDGTVGTAILCAACYKAAREQEQHG